MKLQYLRGEGRKRINRIAALLVIALLFGIFPDVSEPLSVSAAPGDTQQQIDQKEQDRKNLVDQQKQNKNSLEGLRGL